MSSYRRLAAFLVSLAGGGIKVGDEDLGRGDRDSGSAAFWGGDSISRGRGGLQARQLELEKCLLLTILLSAQE